MITSVHYEQIARMIAIRIVGLIRSGWSAPVAIHMTGADDRVIFDQSCDEGSKFLNGYLLNLSPPM